MDKIIKTYKQQNSSVGTGFENQKCLVVLHDAQILYRSNEQSHRKQSLRPPGAQRHN